MSSHSLLQILQNNITNLFTTCILPRMTGIYPSVTYICIYKTNMQVQRIFLQLFAILWPVFYLQKISIHSKPMFIQVYFCLK